MYIKRHMELVVKDCIKQFPVLLITGPRQSPLLIIDFY